MATAGGGEAPREESRTALQCRPALRDALQDGERRPNCRRTAPFPLPAAIFIQADRILVACAASATLGRPVPDILEEYLVRGGFLCVAVPVSVCGRIGQAHAPAHPQIQCARPAFGAGVRSPQTRLVASGAEPAGQQGIIGGCPRESGAPTGPAGVPHRVCSRRLRLRCRGRTP